MTEHWAWIGAAVFSLIFVAVWIAHLFGATPVWDAGDQETCKNIVLAVSGFWIGSAAGKGRTPSAPVSNQPVG